MNSLHLTSPIPPSVNNYLNYKVVRQGRRTFVQTYPTDETKRYRQLFSNYVKKEITKQKWVAPDKNKIVYVELVFYLDRKRKDPNNLLKVMFDVLTECGVYHDDDKVLPVGKRMFIDSNTPRIELKIFEGSEIGVFKDAKEYNSFYNNNCYFCSRNQEKCSILRKLKENRIVPEVIDLKNCSSKKIKREKSSR